MDRSDVITLLTTTYTTDDYGVNTATTTGKDVYCQVDSISMTEFYEAGRNGLNPEDRFRMFAYDYSGETLIEYNGNVYAVYRTYLRRDDTIELYVQREGGARAHQQQPDESPGSGGQVPTGV